MPRYRVVEICAGAGGQSLGLEKAGFDHSLAIDSDEDACNTLRKNRPSWRVEREDVARENTWLPRAYRGVSLLAGGVPCPPFTIAGKQLGATDERDLFAWAVQLVRTVEPEALLLENVRGLSMPRFSGYRQHVLDALTTSGYTAEWKLLQAADFGVPQLRPRFVLVALRTEHAPYFSWPEPRREVVTVGEALAGSMAANGWEGAKRWALGAQKVGPTIVGGSKKHGGPDLGPTRARRAWAELGVDARSVADDAPRRGQQFAIGPKLTCDMVARLQGWSDEYPWIFTGRKTARYRQIGNAFPPPVARAVGEVIMRALKHEGAPRERTTASCDPVYRALSATNAFVPASSLLKVDGQNLALPDLERRISLLKRDFDIETATHASGSQYRLTGFKAFVGQDAHPRSRIAASSRSHNS